jgi:hypothetical protein
VPSVLDGYPRPQLLGVRLGLPLAYLAARWGAVIAAPRLNFGRELEGRAPRSTLSRTLARNVRHARPRQITTLAVSMWTVISPRHVGHGGSAGLSGSSGSGTTTPVLRDGLTPAAGLQSSPAFPGSISGTRLVARRSPHRFPRDWSGSAGERISFGDDSEPAAAESSAHCERRGSIRWRGGRCSGAHWDWDRSRQ